MFVRWTNLTLTDEDQHRLPGYRDEAVVRRFDAPEALDIRFYEVRSEERRVGKECRSRCDWSSDVCSSDLDAHRRGPTPPPGIPRRGGRTPLRRSGGARHPLLRGEIGRASCRERV